MRTVGLPAALAVALVSLTSGCGPVAPAGEDASSRDSAVTKRPDVSSAEPFDTGSPGAPDAAAGGRDAESGRGEDAEVVEAPDGGPPPAGDAGTAVVLKPLPRGIFQSLGPVRAPLDDSIGSQARSNYGALLWLPWDLCDQDCLLETIGKNLDAAQRVGHKLALSVADGFSVPADVKARCTTFDYSFRGEPKTMCLAWDRAYLDAKKGLVRALGDRFDSHPALDYVYFTGACSSNGNEGHCRVDLAAYTAAGYTPEKLEGAYLEIMAAYRAAFPRTPLAFEAHAIFDSAALWEALWQEVEASGRVGIAAWWCAERLSVNGRDTTPVWPLLQRAAVSSFTVCQSVSSFTNQPYDFSDATVGLDYGTANNFSSDDSLRAFADHLSWMKGLAVHARQSRNIAPFSVFEPWFEDATNPAFTAELTAF